MRVNLDKIMHARWDFDASSARALDKHQNWSASALFCLNSRAQSNYAVVNLIHTQPKQTVLSFIMTYAGVNQPCATLTLASALREMFGVQLYKNNARALLLRILSILNLDWLQHARSVRGVYEYNAICYWLVYFFRQWHPKQFPHFQNHSVSLNLMCLFLCVILLSTGSGSICREEVQMSRHVR